MPSENRERAVRFSTFRFEPGQGLWQGGTEVALPPRALGVLEVLVARAGSVVSKAELMDAVWPEAFVTESSLLEAIGVLREALCDDRLNPTFIQTVHRRGYRFIAPVTPAGRESDERHPASPSPAPPEPARHALAWGPQWYPHAAAALGGVVAMMGIATVFALFGQRAMEPRPTMRVTIALPENTVIDPMRGTVAVSADGMRVAYVALVNGHSRLFLRTMDRETPVPIDGSDGAAEPFFSPDGRWVAFFADGSLKKLPIEGGTAVRLCPVRRAAGGVWLTDHTIIFGGASGGGLSRVSADGSAPTVIIAPGAGSRDVSYGWPDVLPNGAGILYTVTSITGSRIAIVDPATGEGRSLLDAAAFGRYSPTGHVVFERRGRLEIVPYSLRDRRATGISRPVVRGIASGLTRDAGPRFAFAGSGSLVYVPGEPALIENQLHWLDSEGRLEPLGLPATPGTAIDLTPDLERVALGVESDAGADLWVGDLRRGALSRLSADGRSTSPTWRPDGLEIAFAYSKAGPFNVFVRPADREAIARPLVESPWNQAPTSWSADGRWLAFTEFHPMTGADIWMLDITGGERHAIVRTLYDESDARFSPDGRWLAYMSNESGRWNVVVRPALGDGPRLQVSVDGGAFPAWSVDGRTLYYSSPAGIVAAAVDTRGRLRVGAPMLLRTRDDVQVTSGRAARDRVLVRPAGPSPRRHELRLVLEWFAELARMPT